MVLAQAAAEPWTVPEVKALVLVQALGSNRAAVDVQVAGTLTDEQAAEIISRAASLGGWSAGPITVKRDVFQPGQWWEAVTGKEAKPERLTLAHFEASGLMDRASGRLAVKEFVQALRDSAPVRVVYKVDEQFVFSGPDDEDYQGFHIAHYQSDGTHTFDAVARQETPAPADAASGRLPARRGFPWLGAMLCAGAAALAAGAGFWRWRLGRSQQETVDETGEDSGN